MTSQIIPPNPVQPVSTVDGRMMQQYRTWTQQVSRSFPVIGSGSPENVVEAEQGQLYMDTAGTAGNILYVKRDADVAGDRTQGWILV